MSIPEIPALRGAGRALPAALLALAACAHRAAPSEPDRAGLADLNDRAGLVLADDPWGDGATKLLYLDQGWSVPETLWFYYADQGSTLMPYEVGTWSRRTTRPG
jgi:hypothetical protein